MISTLSSIDSLLNQFDELTKFHSNLLSDFDANISDTKNPLRHVSPRKPPVNTVLNVDVNDDQFESIGSLEDFRRRIIKYRDLHRPSNDSTSIHRVSSKSFGTTTETVSLSKILVSTSNNRIIEPKIKIPIKDESKPTPRRQARGKIRMFTMETANRLSKPKRYNRVPDQKPFVKHVSQPINLKKVVSKGPTLPPIKQTKINTNPKPIKIEPKILIQTSSKNNSVRNCFRPFVLIKSMAITRPKVPIQFLPKRRFHQ
jgi:hypothetical protein